MSMRKWIGVALVVLGVLALAFGGFSYTQDEHQVDVGPVEFSVKDKERVNVPMWGGIALLVGGVALLVVGRGK